jgi:hypothetical protein
MDAVSQAEIDRIVASLDNIEQKPPPDPIAECRFLRQMISDIYKCTDVLEIKRLISDRLRPYVKTK